MKQILAAQLAEWIDNNTHGFTKRDGNDIYIEGIIDAYDLLVYVQSLLAERTTTQIQADNKASYTGRVVKVAVEGGDFTEA
jgi:hypothetical protein